MAIIYNFPDELVSNETKLSKEFAREYALAMWNEWEGIDSQEVGLEAAIL